MNNIDNNLGWTTKEQSKKLLNTGLSKNTSDMYYGYRVFSKELEFDSSPVIGNGVESLKWYNLGYTQSGKNQPLTLEEYCILCWSIGNILNNILPNKIVVNNNPNLAYYLRIGETEEEFWVSYENESADLKGCFIGFNTVIDKCTKNDCIVNMVCWLLENGYIKKETDD